MCVETVQCICIQNHMADEINRGQILLQNFFRREHIALRMTEC